MSERLWYLKNCDLFQRLGRLQLGSRKIVLTDMPYLADSVNRAVPRLRLTLCGVP